MPDSLDPPTWDEFTNAAALSHASVRPFLSDAFRSSDSPTPGKPGAGPHGDELDPDQKIEAMRRRGLDYLFLTTSLIKELQDNQQTAVDELRKVGVKWREIAQELGVSSSAVQQRFRHPEEEEDRTIYEYDMAESMARIRHKRRPGQLAARGLMSFPLAAWLRDYPNSEDFRIDHDPSHPDHEEDGEDYHSKLRDLDATISNIGLIELWVKGASDVYPGGWDDSMSIEDRKKTVAIADRDPERLRSDPEYFEARRAKLIEDLTLQSEWFEQVLERTLNERESLPPDLEHVRHFVQLFTVDDPE